MDPRGEPGRPRGFTSAGGLRHRIDLFLGLIAPALPTGQDAADQVQSWMAAVERLATASQRLKPWDDSSGGLTRLAQRFPVLGLSHASRATLLRLNAYAGLRWHQAFSAEDAQAYKPAPEVYQLAIDAAGCPPERVLLVAAHAWGLRGAQAVGMRTAYVQRPGGDAPESSGIFVWRSDSLDALVAELTAE
ncbi:haloacid dehalogenase type II [Streptomyces sp. Ac-502]|uniref:haloacid dehalogenase type II n=1 Tax=Streptomyces sp. Ac-502 TaxID=3342801 RepID=UPI0038627B67